MHNDQKTLGKFCKNNSKLFLIVHKAITIYLSNMQFDNVQRTVILLNKRNWFNVKLIVNLRNNN